MGSGKLIAFNFVLCCLLANFIAGHVLKDDAETKLLKRSEQILSFMNESVNPCENFFEFSCGKWKHVFPAEKDAAGGTNYLKHLFETYDAKIITMLKDKQDPKDLEYDKKAKNVFHSCIKLNNKVDASRMSKLVEEFGTMPALLHDGETWEADKFDWLDTLARIIKKYGVSIIIGIEVQTDLKDNSINRVYIGEGEFELESRAVYLEPMGKDYRERYIQQIGGNLKKLLNIKLSEALKIAKSIVDFEVKLARGMKDNKSDQSMDQTNIKTTAEELQKKLSPTIDVKHFMKIIFGEVPEGVIYESGPGYLQNVKETIEGADKRDVANYIFYHMLRRFLIEDSETIEELEKNCFKAVKSAFHKVIDNMSYRRFLNKQITDEIEQFWYKIKNTFKTRLSDTKTIDWLTPETRKKALEKLDALKLYINTYEDYDFGKDFDDLETSEDDFVGNLQNITQLEAEKAFRRINETVAKVDVGEQVSTSPVNVQVENKIYVPMAIVQPYFLWAPNFPDALKFSLMGFLLAHELVHSFDDTGRQFGKSGNLENWWDSESSKQFLERRKCFTDQYHSYVYGKNPLPKTDNQGENIADNGGFKLVYDAFIANNESSNKLASHKLPGLNYTDKQLFFIGYGQMWCSDVEQSMLDLQTATDEHTPEKFRNIGVISNSKEFAEAFNCPVGSKMNPDKKCQMY